MMSMIVSLEMNGFVTVPESDDASRDAVPGREEAVACHIRLWFLHIFLALALLEVHVLSWTTYAATFQCCYRWFLKNIHLSAEVGSWIPFPSQLHHFAISAFLERFFPCYHSPWAS
jgi:hypothetical protein